MPKTNRGKAVDLLTMHWSYPKSDAKETYKRYAEYTGHSANPGSLLENQMLQFQEQSKGYNRRGQYGMVFGTAKSFSNDHRFLSAIREALKRRNRRGVTTFFKSGGDVESIINGVYLFFKNNRLRISKEEFERVLEDSKLREELIEYMAETVPVRSGNNRYDMMEQRLINELKESGEKEPVIIDYGAGTLESSIGLERKLRKAGIKGHVIATDKMINQRAMRKQRRSRVAYVKHDLRTSSYLTGRKKADAVRLGWVLPYIFKENVGKIIRHVMQDVKVGGLICLGDPESGYRIFRKMSATEVELIHHGNEYIEKRALRQEK